MADRRNGGYVRHGDRQEGQKSSTAPNSASAASDGGFVNQSSGSYGNYSSGYTDDGRTGRTRTRRENTGGHEYPNKLAAPHHASGYGYASEMHRYSPYQPVHPSYTQNMPHYPAPYAQDASQFHHPRNSVPLGHPGVPMAPHYPYQHTYYHQTHTTAAQASSSTAPTLTDPLQPVVPKSTAVPSSTPSTAATIAPQVVQTAKKTTSTTSLVSSTLGKGVPAKSTAPSSDAQPTQLSRPLTSKPGANVSTLPHDATSGSLNKAPGAPVLFSFDKVTRAPTKSALGSHGSSSKLPLYQTTPSASLPPPTAPSILHKPGGTISFVKPIVTPIKPPPPPVPPPADPPKVEPTAPLPPVVLPPSKPQTSENSQTLAPSAQPPATNGRPISPNVTTPTSSSSSSVPVQKEVPATPRPGPPTYGMRALDTFKILSEISEGTYGIVYKAVDNQTGEIVAMKKVKIDPVKEKDVGFPVSAVREIRALALLQHDHVVRLRDIIPDDSNSTLYLILDYIEHDLNQILKRHRHDSRPSTPQQIGQTPTPTTPSNEEPIPPLFTTAHIKSLVHQLLTSIAFIHTKSFMHRDIKTSNLLLSTAGKLYLADFGLTKQWKPSEPRTPKVVTIAYRAPELVFQAPDYGLSVDMWSVGLVMAELLTGREFLRGVKTDLDLISKMVEIFGSPNEQNYGKSYNQLKIASPGSSLAIKPQPENKLKSFFPALSRQGFDLLSRMLCYDPDTRITAAQALAHPWFKEYPEPARPQLTSDGKIVDETPKPAPPPAKPEPQAAPPNKSNPTHAPRSNTDHFPHHQEGSHHYGALPPPGYPPPRRYEDDYPRGGGGGGGGGYRQPPPRGQDPYYRDVYYQDPPRRRFSPRRFGDGPPPPYGGRPDHRHPPPRLDDR